MRDQGIGKPEMIDAARVPLGRAPKILHHQEKVIRIDGTGLEFSGLLPNGHHLPAPRLRNGGLGNL